MRIFKNRRFARIARKESIRDHDLCKAIADAESGLIDADLGGVIKQRIARPNEGTSGGYRSIIFFRSGEKAFFVYCFAKNDLSNIDQRDLNIFKQTARVTLSFDDEKLKGLLKSKTLIEVNCDGQDL